ncbi:MAG: hypothetical protein FWC19_01805 [Treponema sp.]|nr:hypothetical protein [Treponema sp.]MCL2271527.1 hypothetical protein [Treponema sp.]
MVNKRFWLGMLVTALVLSFTLASCMSSGHVRDAVPQIALTLQRPRSTVNADLPLQIFVNNVPYELANGESKTILVNNGEYMVYAVLGEVESKSARFTAKDKSRTVSAVFESSLTGIFDSLYIDIR